MDWIDYREKLGIGFNDEQKTYIFTTNVLSACEKEKNDIYVDRDEYFDFCTMTGVIFEDWEEDYFESITYILTKQKDNLLDFISYYVAFINSLDKKKENRFWKDHFIDVIEKYLEKSHIIFDVLRDEDDNYFIFPKGAKELDNALVSEPLNWLESYPSAHKTFCNALKQYSEGIYIRDVADNLRKALESFLQEFLNNTKNLESNKNDICKYLGEQGVDPGISGLYKPLIDSYKNINDRIAKHNDKVDKKMLEFLLYQTGVLIRMTMVVKNAENKNN